MSDHSDDQPTPLNLANTCLHCAQTREQHSSDRQACVKAGYYGNRFTTTLDATITIAYGDATPVTITLDGTELSESSQGNHYLTGASRGFIADEVEQALITLIKG